MALCRTGASADAASGPRGSSTSKSLGRPRPLNSPRLGHTMRFLLALPLATALQLGSRGWTTPRVCPVASTPAAEAELLSLLEASGQEDRGKDLSAQELANVHRLAVELESGAAADQDTNDSPLLPGRWRVLYQGKPGTTTSFFSVESWRSYFSGDGPSPCAEQRRAPRYQGLLLTRSPAHCAQDSEPRLRLEYRVPAVPGRRD